tara:strand:- start:151 stop:447 length:297 start_codon:yes stop_codon:yes gene_type:complete
MNWFIDFCALLKWFIIGGKKPVVVFNKRQKLTRDLAIECEKRWANARYLRAHRNAASNLGMLGEARKWWFEQPYEWRKRQEDKWKKRYGKDWRKHVVI